MGAAVVGLDFGGGECEAPITVARVRGSDSYGGVGGEVKAASMGT